MRFAPFRFARLRFAPVKFALIKSAPTRFAPVKSALARFAPGFISYPFTIRFSFASVVVDTVEAVELQDKIRKPTGARHRYRRLNFMSISFEDVDDICDFNSPQGGEFIFVAR
jgi:hypothetical protein